MLGRQVRLSQIRHRNLGCLNMTKSMLTIHSYPGDIVISVFRAILHTKLSMILYSSLAYNASPAYARQSQQIRRWYLAITFDQRNPFNFVVATPSFHNKAFRA